MAFKIVEHPRFLPHKCGAGVVKRNTAFKRFLIFVVEPWNAVSSEVAKDPFCMSLGFSGF